MFVGIKLTKRKAQHTLESDNATQTQIRIGRTMEENGFHVCELSWIYRGLHINIKPTIVASLSSSAQ